MAMLPTLPTQNAIMVNQMRRRVLPGNVAEKCFSFAEKKRRECFYNLILPFCPTTFLAQPSAPYFSFSAARTFPHCGHGLLCRSCIKLDGHSVFKLAFRKNKRRITMRPCGCSNRNPSKFINEYSCFLNVRMQCNIRGRESQ